MRSQHSRTRSWAAAALACAVLAAAACTSDDEAPAQVDASQVEAVPASAVDVESRAEVGLPSGTLSLGLAPELATVSTSAGSLTPGSDVTMLGLTWSFEPHPSSDARDALLDGQDLESLPPPSVALIDGAVPVPVPVVAQAGASGGVVMGVTDPARIEVEYDGLIQTVDLDTGAVGAGQAEGLTDLSDATTTVLRPCPARDFPPAAVLDHGCRVEEVHLLPYIDGRGWAPDSQTWLVVDARIDGDATMLLGDDPGTVLDGAPPAVQRVAFAVAGNSPRTIDFDFGPPIGAVSVPLAS